MWTFAFDLFKLPTYLFLFILCVSQEDALLAFQIAFDLVENENQAFLLSVRNLLAPTPSVNPEPPTDAPDVAGGDVQMVDESSNEPNGSVEVDPAEVLQAERLSKISGILSGETPIKLTLQFLYSHNRFSINSPHDIFFPCLIVFLQLT